MFPGSALWPFSADNFAPTGWTLAIRAYPINCPASGSVPDKLPPSMLARRLPSRSGTVHACVHQPRPELATPQVAPRQPRNILSGYLAGQRHHKNSHKDCHGRARIISHTFSCHILCLSWIRGMGAVPTPRHCACLPGQTQPCKYQARIGPRKSAQLTGHRRRTARITDW